MTSFTLTDVGNKSGAVVEAAFRGAVDITKCGKRKFVLLTAEQFDRLAGGTAQRAEDLTAPKRNTILAGLDASRRTRDGMNEPQYGETVLDACSIQTRAGGTRLDPLKRKACPYIFLPCGRIMDTIMGERADLLRSPEAAFVSGIAVKAVDRAIDEHLLPKGFYVLDGGRRLTPGACVMIAFYHAAADNFTPGLRKHIITRFEDRLRHVEFNHCKALARENWKLGEHYWSVDLAPFIERTACSYERLREAEAAVSRDEDVMSGAEVLRGTRVPVHDIAASAGVGEPIERIRDAYPSLTDRQIQLAIVYATAHPQRGRPRGTALPAGTTHVERKVVQRKTAG